MKHRRRQYSMYSPYWPHTARGTVLGDNATQVALAARVAAARYFGHDRFALTRLDVDPLIVDGGEVVSWEGRWEAVARMEET